MSNEQDKKTKDRVLNEKFHPFTRACYEGMKADRASEPTVTDYDRMMDQQLNLIEAKTGKPIRLTPEQAANWLQWLQSRLEDHLRLDEVYRIEFQQCKVGDLCPDGSMVIEVDAEQLAVSRLGPNGTLLPRVSSKRLKSWAMDHWTRGIWCEGGWCSCSHYDPSSEEGWLRATQAPKP